MIYFVITIDFITSNRSSNKNNKKVFYVTSAKLQPASISWFILDLTILTLPD